MREKFKSIASAVLAVCICIGMAGCENDKDKDLDNFSEEDFIKNAEKLETLYGEEEDSSSAEEKKDSGGITASDEILSAEIYSGKIQLGNTVFSFPKFPVSELIEAGAVFKEDDPETTILNGNYRTSSGREVRIDGITYSLHFSNDDENRQILKDCYVSMGGLDTYDSFNKSFICPKGITIGSTIDELFEAYGEPTSVDIDKYTYTDPDYLIESEGARKYGAIHKDGLVNTGGNSYTFYVDLKTNTINKISVDTNAVNYGNEIIEESTEIKARIDGEKIKFNVYYSYPQYLGDGFHIYDNNGNRMLIYFSVSTKNIGPNTSDDIKQTDITEYTDETLSAFCENVYAKDKEPEKYCYGYKINGSTAVAVICKNEGLWVKVEIVYLDENFRYVSWGGNTIHIFPSIEVGELTTEDIESTYDIFFSIAESVKLEME